MPSLPLNPHLARVQPPPIMKVQAWLADAPGDRALLNLSQAAPADPPPRALRERLAQAMLEEPSAHFYGPVPGNDALRLTIAEQWSEIYGGQIDAANVAVTAGCNQAFCVAVATACAPGETVMLPYPWYFNHKMWLDMAGIACLPLPPDANMLPDLAAARTAMHADVRAIVLVTPNNPTGAEYPDDLMRGFRDLARENGAVLVVDETYRDFHGAEGAPHSLFQSGWEDVLVHLYSFSKVFRLTGHRTGALIAGAERLAAAEKFLDTVTICPAQSGQIAALEGLRTLGNWVAGERAEILARAGPSSSNLFAERLPDWRVISAGAYFAWVAPPWDEPAEKLARRLVAEQGVLVLPGTMFLPEGHATSALRDRVCQHGPERSRHPRCPAGGGPGLRLSRTRYLFPSGHGLKTIA